MKYLLTIIFLFSLPCYGQSFSSGFGIGSGQTDYYDSYSNQPTQRYNAYENRWETTRDNAELKYNPYENSWEYTTDEQPTYNPYENKWEYSD